MKHGMKGTPTYNSWRGMKNRCTHKTHMYWINYGGRGIKVCPEWQQDFMQFFADMGERPEGMSLDRIDNDGDYEPGNCRWASRADQTRNARRQKTAKSQFKGVSYSTENALRGKPWRARIYENKRSVLIGNFATEIEAATALHMLSHK